jgi:hypothetical protein
MVQGCRGCCDRTGSCRKIGLVVWKNLLLRKRHWIILLFEIVLPILSILVVCAINSRTKHIRNTDSGRPGGELADNPKDQYEYDDPGRRFRRSITNARSILDMVCFSFLIPYFQQ